jgi:hypothetical protein
MPQLHTPQLSRLYVEVAAWGLRLADIHPTHRVLWGGGFQSTTQQSTGSPSIKNFAALAPPSFARQYPHMQIIIGGGLRYVLRLNLQRFGQPMLE